MYSLRDCQEKIEEAIRIAQIDGQPEELYAPIRYIMSIGGKRMRPALVLMAYNMYAADIVKVTNVALAIEVFHNFTLLHDDIMDEADVRRNMATVHKKWNNNAAILSGDAMLIKAYQLLETLPVDIQPAVYRIFNQTALEVCEGQQYDMNFETQSGVSLDEYLKMITLKTAVLVAASLKIGALLGGATAEDADNIYEFGLNLGLAFQIQDDYLDAFADSNEFGKATGGDIAANKKTFLLINALELATGDIAEELDQLIHQDNIDKEEKIHRVIAIYRQLGIPELAKQKIEAFHKKSLESLKAIQVPDLRKEQLYHFAEYLMSRKK
ncbi:MAG: polyprenyl synthetase family protein [Mariniphaga sp.]